MSPQTGWVAQDLQDRTRWIQYFTPAELDAVDRAIKAARQAQRGLGDLTRENFPLPELQPTFDRVLATLEDGLGFHVLRGLPAGRYTKDDMRLLYWGMGLHLGTAVTQSSRGDMLGDVRDFGVDTFAKKGRGYMSRQHLEFHADSCDVVCLMVLRVAKSGGASRFCSSIAIHDEIARTRPDLLQALYQPFPMSWKGQEAPGEKSWYLQPMFSRAQGRLSSRFIPQHVIGTSVDPALHPQAPVLQPRQREALEHVTTLANHPKFYVEMMFEPGDMQFMNNHVMYHSRTEFEDHAEADRKRHLIRLWLSVPNSRPLDDAMNAIYRDRRPGAVRGGFPCHTGARVFETPVITD